MSLNRQSYSTNGNQTHCSYLQEELLHQGDWLRLIKVKYLDPRGKERSWEAVTRVSVPRGAEPDSVAAIAIYRRLLHYDVIVLVRQYRPAVNGYTIEFPAGFVEAGESSEQAALRELKEETGWHGEVTHMSSSIAADPTCTASMVKFATVKINGDATENKINKPQPRDGEFVDLIMLPVSELHDRLARLTKEGNVIDCRVEAFAIGLTMGMKFAKDAEIDTASNNQSSLPVDGSGVRTGLKAFKQQK